MIFPRSRAQETVEYLMNLAAERAKGSNSVHSYFGPGPPSRGRFFGAFVRCRCLWARLRRGIEARSASLETPRYVDSTASRREPSTCTVERCLYRDSVCGFVGKPRSCAGGVRTANRDAPSRRADESSGESLNIRVIEGTLTEYPCISTAFDTTGPADTPVCRAFLFSKGTIGRAEANGLAHRHHVEISTGAETADREIAASLYDGRAAPARLAHRASMRFLSAAAIPRSADRPAAATAAPASPYRHP